MIEATTSTGNERGKCGLCGYWHTYNEGCPGRKRNMGGGLGRYHSKDYYKCECGERFRNVLNFKRHKKKCDRNDR